MEHRYGPGDLRRYITPILLFIAIIGIGHTIAYKIVHVPSQFEFVVLFTLAVLYPIIRYPIIGLYLLFWAMPLIPFFRRLYYLSYQRPSADPLIAIGDIILVIMLIGLFFTFKRYWIDNQKSHPYILFLLLYVSYLFMRTFVFNIEPLSNSILHFRFYGPAVFLFFIGMMCANSLHHLRRLWILTLIMGCASALYGAKQLYFGYSEAEHMWFATISFSTLFMQGKARPFSFFQSPAAFADFMQMALISIMVLVMWYRTKKRFFLLLLFPLFIFGSLITSVRSNWIGALLSFVIWILVFIVRSSKRRIAIIVVTSVCFIFFDFITQIMEVGIEPQNVLSIVERGTMDQDFFKMLVTNRFSGIANPFNEYSFVSRLTLWKYLLILSKNPIYGIMGRGLGTLNADSLYFTYLAEFGYPGLVCIIGITFIFLIKGFSLVSKTKNPKTYALGTGITIMNITLLVMNITGTHIHSFPGDIYFWFWNGVLIHLSFSEEYTDAHPANT